MSSTTVKKKKQKQTDKQNNQVGRIMFNHQALVSAARPQGQSLPPRLVDQLAAQNP